MTADAEIRVKIGEKEAKKVKMRLNQSGETGLFVVQPTTEQGRFETEVMSIYVICKIQDAALIHPCRRLSGIRDFVILLGTS